MTLTELKKWVLQKFNSKSNSSKSFENISLRFFAPSGELHSEFFVPIHSTVEITSRRYLSGEVPYFDVTDSTGPTQRYLTSTLLIYFGNGRTVLLESLSSLDSSKNSTIGTKTENT